MVQGWKYSGSWAEAKLLLHKTCIEVPWYIPAALSSLGEPFILYLFSDDPISHNFTTVLDNFLQRESLDRLIVAVNVKDENILKEFSVCILPQLRFFSEGKEIRRLHGTKNYDELYELLRH